MTILKHINAMQLQVLSCLAFIFLFQPTLRVVAEDAAPKPGFDELITAGRQSMAAGKLDDGLITGMGAIQAAPDRFEGYALVGMIFQKKGDNAEAADFIDKAIAHAPESKKALLQQIKAGLGTQARDASSGAANASATLTSEERRQLSALMLIIDDADHAQSPADRQPFLREYLEKSAAFVAAHPDRTDLWSLRAVAALELNRSGDGREAAHKLLELGADKSDDAKTQKVIAMLERRGWFADVAPLLTAPRPDPAKNVVIGLPNGQRLEFIWIPTPGEFMMGDAPQGGQDDHRPRVRLTKAFYISKTPVTQAEYEGIAGSNPSQFKDSGPNAPVERVSWDEAMEFCRKTTESLRANGQNAGWEITLPTEAQWEYACRAGTDTAYYTGDSESDLSRAGWYSGNSGQRTHPVGEKEANAWGLYDMHGNVWQWCFDWYGDLPSGSAVDPTGASSGPNRVYRGGSWRFDAVNCRSAHRTGFEPGFRFNNVGFRLALSSVR